MKNILLYLFVFLISSCVYANELNFAQVSDVHYATHRNNPYQYRMIENIDELFNDAISQINISKNLDFVFFTGDQIDFSEEENLKKFILRADTLQFPWHFCFGNHDVYKYGPLTRKKYFKIIKNNAKHCKTNKNYYTFSPQKGYTVIVLDSFEDKISKPNGKINKKQLQWLDKQLCKNRNNIVLIFTHTPIKPPFEHGENDMYIYDHSMENSTEVMTVLKKYKNPIAVFSGHYHVSKIIQINNIIHVNSPSIISYPNAFRVVNISKNNNIVTFKIRTQDTNLKEVQTKAKNLIKNAHIYEGSNTDKNNIFTIKMK